MGESTEPFCQGLAQYLEKKLAIPTNCVAGIPWQERERLFDQGAIQVLWLCGWPYVQKARLNDFVIELLSLPIPLGSRYRAEPIYFSDVIVKCDSRFRVFHDLLGFSWPYNEPLSHSGFNVVRAYLTDFGQSQEFFRAVVESRSHVASIEMILNAQVEASPSIPQCWIGSLTSGLKFALKSVSSKQLVQAIPSWMASTQLPGHVRSAIRRTFLGVHEDSAGRAILARGRIMRFVAAHDTDYDPIRRMADVAATVSLL